MKQDDVFKALADENRRRLLDILFQQDGQTLTDLCAHFAMSRYGVMKHLHILEEAGLVVTRKVGRSKYHYLNPVPLQEVYDRWVSKYARPWSQALVALKDQLEENQPMAAKPMHVQQIFIKTTPEKLWHALTDGDMTRQYYMNTRVESTWEPGAPYRYLWPNDVVMLEGEVTESDPPRRLVTTFQPRWDAAASALPASTVMFEIEPVGDSVRLTLTHIDLDPAHPATSGIVDGWTRILSSLKSLLETGEPLRLS